MKLIYSNNQHFKHIIPAICYGKNLNGDYVIMFLFYKWSLVLAPKHKRKKK